MLADDEVHVVAIALDPPAPRLDDAAAVLDDDERARAARFVRDADRRRYVLAHAAFRAIAGAATGVAPAAVRWELGPAGKPSIAGAPSLGISLSHSGERALVALARGRDVGVDLEEMRAIDVLEVARTTFSPAELAAVRARDGDRLAAFYRVWVRKEALVKARGDGLGGPLGAFDVSCDDEVDDALLASRLGDRRRWSIRPLPLDDVHVGAVAASGGAWRVVRWDGHAAPRR